MQAVSAARRILALEIRAARFAFVVMESSRGLIDCGVKRTRSTVHDGHIPLRKKFADLFDEFSPTVMVIRRATPTAPATTRILTKIATEEAKKSAIPYRVIRRATIKQTFVGHDKNKDEIAAAVVKRFPELGMKRPARRKCWQSENYWMGVFDAAALGLAYLSRSGQQTLKAPIAS